ncbi:UDP-N-acetylglucosamine 2-epimerase [Pseudorhodoplanes sp.]|uniref:UDP-N-acetylglucosamine 2-epimerase n=1 Tax=Pseudorhodoplanes sp. TaxID=1934341 RepID=UPI003D150B21
MRRILSITGSRADYGLMRPVHDAIAATGAFDLHLLVTGMHHLPDFASGLEQVRCDRFGTLHDVAIAEQDDTGTGMAQAIGHGTVATAVLIEQVKPDIVVLQGDRGEMLAGAIAAAHMNVPIVHMSGGDFSGSIDDSVRNAISKLAHFHLTSSDASTRRLQALGEMLARIVETGDPAIDQLRLTETLPLAPLKSELGIPEDSPFLLATLHPVTDEADRAGAQMQTMLEALAALRMPAIVTFPNSDAGGRAMRDVLNVWRQEPFIRAVASLGSRRYLTLLRHAAAVIGNSSSGIVEAPALKIPVVNIGSRQQNRLRAPNVVDVPHDADAIVKAVRFVREDRAFLEALAQCGSPYGDGHAAERTIDVLTRLKLGPDLIAKWRDAAGPFLA